MSQVYIAFAFGMPVLLDRMPQFSSPFSHWVIQTPHSYGLTIIGINAHWGIICDNMNHKAQYYTHQETWICMWGKQGIFRDKCRFTNKY